MENAKGHKSGSGPLNRMPNLIVQQSLPILDSFNKLKLMSMFVFTVDI